MFSECSANSLEKKKKKPAQFWVVLGGFIWLGDFPG